MNAENKRKLFVLVWSVLSVLGIIIQIYYVPVYELMSIILYYMTGFHVPQDAIFYGVLFERFTDYPETGLLFLLAGIVFLVFWIISLFRLSCGQMFERLILSDRVVSLLMLTLVTITQRNEFNDWYLFALSVVDVIVVFIVSRIIKKRNLCNQNTPKSDE